MDDFFHYVSKGVIIVPIIIIILSLIFKFNQSTKINSSSYILPVQSPTPTPVNVKKLKINLNEKWLCHYKVENQEYKLLIDNGKINLEATVSGQSKKYDLTPYSSIIESMLNMDVNQLENMAKSYLPQGVDFGSLIESCKKL